jgi:MarR family 2-MHQ and catechol resistance regulon transcriptional repressor
VPDGVPKLFYIYKDQTMEEMGIEQDIKQSKFRNAWQKAGINLIFTTSWLRDKTKAIFDQEEITPQQFNILRILRGSYPDPLSTMQIRERMLEKMSDTSRIVDRLITKGLVKKVICKSDRRLVDVIITDKGKKMLERLDLRQDEIDAILGKISEKEANVLSELLDRIRAAGE